MVKINKIERIALAGGIIGALTTNPKRALEKCIDQSNSEGWNVRQVIHHSTSNLFIIILQLLILICTIGLWTFGAGYMIIFEKEK